MEDLANVFFIVAALFIIVKVLTWKFDCEEAEGPDPVPKPWIMEKVAKANKNRANYLECLRTDICPACGGGLKERVQGTADFSYHNCKSCSFKSSGEILY